MKKIISIPKTFEVSLRKKYPSGTQICSVCKKEKPLNYFWFKVFRLKREPEYNFDWSVYPECIECCEHDDDYFGQRYHDDIYYFWLNSLKSKQFETNYIPRDIKVIKANHAELKRNKLSP